ncbi:RmlD substrate binding domain protein [Mariniflexile rhizosphaerae]|uniref:sugar nucleotide-binding protein n=1 Tax=unclassified Mariniflexile TaxID=2643887 RepID=UPI000CC11A30|nr:sugar nucleotide-binding protein [Mariniflexile sp. TRM1-10]AXP82587.1 RmlD substrate binding domain protein [Mariniflexile sp. TRM1-10]PLB19598.1 MAG: RmlD substrate binding domain protein [Flavobacteriaceae bacterium FS1-H7996/R]
MKAQGKESKHRILILGASGFLGNAIYRELCSYFKTFGTYNTSNIQLEKNKHFFQYNFEEDDVYEILNIVKPTIIISALRGDFATQFIAHKHVAEYVFSKKTKIIFLSSSNVFDAYSKYPSYEEDKTLSNSVYGHFKIKIENMLLRLPKNQVAILRLPMVFGKQSPRVQEIARNISEDIPVEVFPNLIMNVTTDSKVALQIHYIINRNKSGIFHLGSTDLVHHDEFIKDLTKSLGLKNAIYKQVYTTNDDRYLAVLPKYNLLPIDLQIISQDIITELEV